MKTELTIVYVFFLQLVVVISFFVSRVIKVYLVQPVILVILVPLWVSLTIHHTTLYISQGGRWHLNWGGRARGNDWSGISGMVSNTSSTLVSMVSRYLMPFHSLRSGRYYEPSSPHQPPLVYLCFHSPSIILYTGHIISDCPLWISSHFYCVTKWY